jgi:thiol-disulfide isomerase/thioredoxin
LFENAVILMSKSSSKLRNLALTGTLILFAFPGLAAATDKLQLDDYRGKIVVLDFWASWCAPCRHSFPWMNEIQEKYRDEGLVVIAVNLDNDIDAASQFLQEVPAAFLIAFDEDRSLVREYDVQAMPSSFVIGRDGEIIQNHLGFKVSKTAEYEAAIVAALHSDHQQTRTSQ